VRNGTRGWSSGPPTTRSMLDRELNAERNKTGRTASREIPAPPL
jgi:hypothetical protein